MDIINIGCQKKSIADMCVCVLSAPFHFDVLRYPSCTVLSLPCLYHNYETGTMVSFVIYWLPGYMVTEEGKTT